MIRLSLDTDACRAAAAGSLHASVGPAPVRGRIRCPEPAEGLARGARLAAFVFIAAIGAPVAVAAGPTDPAGAAHADRQAADRAFDAGRYAEALTAYEALGRGGDAAAARRAGELWLYGGGLLPAAAPCAAWRAAGWLAGAAAAGDTDAHALWMEAVGHPAVTAAAPTAVR